jgi:flagellar motor protein MotB
MTYSDVITLLMTFFILLLTFASNEPEQFERMKVSLFGAGGGTGVSRRTQTAGDRESIVHRLRTPASRQTTRGSEVSILEDGLSPDRAGWEALLETHPLANSQRIVLLIRHSDWWTTRGDLTPIGEFQWKQIARQLKLHPWEVTVRLSDTDQSAAVISTLLNVLQVHGLASDRISLGHEPALPTRMLRLEFQFVTQAPPVSPPVEGVTAFAVEASQR